MILVIYESNRSSVERATRLFSFGRLRARQIEELARFGDSRGRSDEHKIRWVDLKRCSFVQDEFARWWAGERAPTPLFLSVRFDPSLFYS